MNERDFSEWVEYHTACLPSVGSWIANHHDQQRLFDSWSKALTDISLADACAATDAIVAGTVERPYPEETASVVRRFAVELSLSRRETKPEPDGNGKWCELCRNTGLVTIWHPLVCRGVLQAVDVFRGKDGNAFRVVDENGDVKKLTAVAPCNCALGAKFATKMVKRGDHYEPEDVRRYTPSFWHARIQDRSANERATMTIREQVLADAETAGISSNVF